MWYFRFVHCSAEDGALEDISDDKDKQQRENFVANDE